MLHSDWPSAAQVPAPAIPVLDGAAKKEEAACDILRMLFGFYLILSTHALAASFRNAGKPCFMTGILIFLMQAAPLDAHSCASPEDEAHVVVTCFKLLVQCWSSWLA